jgi:hypothetical protein
VITHHPGPHDHAPHPLRNSHRPEQASGVRLRGRLDLARCERLCGPRSHCWIGRKRGVSALAPETPPSIAMRASRTLDHRRVLLVLCDHPRPVTALDRFHMRGGVLRHRSPRNSPAQRATMVLAQHRDAVASRAAPITVGSLILNRRRRAGGWMSVRPPQPAHPRARTGRR